MTTGPAYSCSGKVVDVLDDIKRMDVAEFVEQGYLQELNRRFLHPFGLAIEVVVDFNGRPVCLGGVWDYRDDPEGIMSGDLDRQRAVNVFHIEEERKPERINRLGYWIQPIFDAN